MYFLYFFSGRNGIKQPITGGYGMKQRSFQFFLAISLASGLLGALTGCGSGISGTVSTVSSSASKQCSGCHATNSKSISKTSGVRITDEWQLSAHNTAHGAGCLDCHSNAHYHDNTVDCRSCHATAHSNNGTSCTLCHGASSNAAADCRSCHANAHKNPDSCYRCHSGNVPVDVAMKNPDSAGKCLNCHNNQKNFKRYSVAARHFNNLTGAGKHPAMYVTSNYQKGCTACHEPHNPLKGLGREQRKAWAKSGHGDVNGIAWADRDFKKSVDCIRCHTTTGFVNFTESNFSLPKATWANAGDNGREVLTCRACHLSSNFKNSVRQIDKFTAPYGVVNSVIYAPTPFPDVGESNLCIPCHSGRENGASIKRTVANFGNASFKNPHYLAAAAVFYGLGGFQFYSSANQTPFYPQAYTSKYGVVVDGTIIKSAAASTTVGGVPAISVGDSLTGRKAPWNHGKLGMDNYITAAPATGANIGTNRDPFGKIIDSGSKGQCVACHLGPKADHTLGAFNVARTTWGTNTTAAMGCYGCHNSEDMEEVAEEERLLVDRTLVFFKWQLLQIGAEYKNVHPYFYQPGTAIAVKNWSALLVPGGVGAANMGAAMNFELLTAEKGVHVHNRTFMKQLIFDSLQYLQNGKVSFSNRYIATNAQSNPNGLISFTGYSTALAAAPDKILNPPTSAASANGVPGQPISITQLKAYITRRNTGSSGAIGSAANPLYTRP